MRYGNLAKKGNNENDESHFPNNELSYEQSETLKELNMLNTNKESVLQKINEMKNKAMLFKK